MDRVGRAARLLRCMSQQLALDVGCARNLSAAIEGEADVARTTAVRAFGPMGLPALRYQPLRAKKVELLSRDSRGSPDLCQIGADPVVVAFGLSAQSNSRTVAQLKNGLPGIRQLAGAIHRPQASDLRKGI